MLPLKVAGRKRVVTWFLLGSLAYDSDRDGNKSPESQGELRLEENGPAGTQISADPPNRLSTGKTERPFAGQFQANPRRMPRKHYLEKTFFRRAILPMLAPTIEPPHPYPPRLAGFDAMAQPARRRCLAVHRGRLGHRRRPAARFRDRPRAVPRRLSLARHAQRPCALRWQYFHAFQC